MNGFKTLLSKELREQIRTFKVLIVAGVFLFFGLTTPVLTKYTPELIEEFGGGVVLEMPPPTALQALVEYSSTALQIGLLIVVLIAMGAISGERRSGTAALTLSKPVGTGAFVTAKLLAISATFLIGLTLGSVGGFGYTQLLFDEGNLGGFVAQTALLSVFLVFCVSVTLVFSAIFRNALAAGGVSIAVLIVMLTLSAIPWIGRVMPGSLTSWGNHLVAGESGGAEWLALGVTLFLVALCAWLATKILRGKEI